MVDDGAGEIQIGRRSFDVVAVQRPDQPSPSLAAVRSPGRHLGEKRVVVDRDQATGVDPAVDSRVRIVRLRVARDQTRGGQEVPRRILGADAGLHGPAADRHVLLADRQPLTGGDAQLELDEIQ